MSVPVAKILAEMVRCNAGDPKRVQHAVKVYAFAKTIGECEGLPAETLEILEAAAVLHDIGIHRCEEKYRSTAGKYQEIEGPPIARQLLVPFGLSDAFVDRVCFLIGHHHTYDAVDGPDYRILIEADFLVNAYEDELPLEACRTALEKVFRTETGTKFLRQMFFML